MVKYFKKGNKKLGDQVLSISCSPILNCPGAPIGGCQFTKKNGKRCSCYAMGIRNRYPSVKKYHEHVDQLFNEKTLGEGYRTLQAELDGLKKRPRAIRLFGSGGDFRHQQVVTLFKLLAMANTDIVFYAYTKSMNLDFEFLPTNFRIIQSIGGRFDHLINWNLPVARVFRSEEALIAENALCMEHGEVPWKDGSNDDTLAEQGFPFIALIAR